MKKCMIKDFDGSFIGHVGTVLPDSAYEWDGDRARGLGDYRIPLVMLTTSAGDKIDVNSYAPHKGGATIHQSILIIYLFFLYKHK